MSRDSIPEYGTAPTFDEVVAYAFDNGLFGKISLVKFFDYYGDFKGKGGAVIDWKAKLFQWAEHQRTKVIISAKEYEALQRVQGKVQKPATVKSTAADIWAKVEMI